VALLEDLRATREEQKKAAAEKAAVVCASG